MAEPDDELQAYLTSLTGKVRARLAAVVKEQAEELSNAQHAVLLRLEQDPSETGDLAASCQAVEGDNDLEYIVQAGGELTTTTVREGSGVPFDYALAFEFGTRHQPARPFFWPTYRERREGIRQAIGDAVLEALK